MHIGGQSVCLAAGANGSPAGPDTPLAVDIIIRQQHLREDLPLLIAEINRRRDPLLPPIPELKISYNLVRPPQLHKRHYDFATDMPHTAKEAYSGSNAKCLSLMAKHFRRDFELLGFQLPAGER